MSNPKDATGTADPRRFKQGASDANYKRVLDRFGERGVFDLIAVNGFYSLVSMCLNVDRTPLPDGVPLPLK